ncbi:hypothetical protein XAPC_2492 [Xanthomonas citri pv. punicae str. LMG 859]|nr:hypothetical protein XAPC_2492 [Xanthomonas citri pv. punicae str. LMG 859]
MTGRVLQPQRPRPGCAPTSSGRRDTPLPTPVQQDPIACIQVVGGAHRLDEGPRRMPPIEGFKCAHDTGGICRGSSSPARFASAHHA